MDNDELALRRRTNATESASRHPEADLGKRERVAAADDRAADERDNQAEAADQTAWVRDRLADQRDTETEAMMAGAPPEMLRRRAADDREAAADDRASALDDRFDSHIARKRSKSERDRAADDRDALGSALAYVRELAEQAEDKAEHRLLIGQAQGRLMEAQGIEAAEALLEVFKEAARTNADLAQAARQVVHRFPTVDA
jgi:hypothetical protein